MNILIKNIKALLFQDDKFVIKDTDILIKDNVISQISDNIICEQVDKEISGKNKLAMPGLINTHTHSYMTLFRNAADDLPFSKWLFKNILPLEDKMTAEDAYWGSMLGIMEMINTGTTCFTDMYMFIDKTARAVEETGIRAFLSRGLVDAADEAGGRRRLEEANKEMKNWNGKCDRIQFLYAPHAPYTCSPEYLEKIAEQAADKNIGITIHLSESRNEVEEIYSKYKMTSTQLIEKSGIFNCNTIAAHCVYIDERDMAILKKNNVSISTNPVSNLKLANGIAPLKEIIENGINVCMGTDGAASNNTLNMFKEMQILSLIHKGYEEDAEILSANEVLKCATINGAKALGISGSVGVLKEGMKADICIIDIDKPQYYPRNNLVSSLVYSTCGEEVATVIVDGKILMENKEFLTIDTEEVKYNIGQINKRLRI